jgi:tetratricopeptide (TPR) repeat protein
MTRTAKISAACLVTAVAFAGGCQSTPRTVKNAVDAYWNGDYPHSAALLKPLTEKKDENFVLNNCRYGSAALAAGQIDEAENAFLDAYLVINGAQTNDQGRQTAAAMVLEKFKVWKGEPFERAMAHYYLGMIYLSKNDPGNARAAFQNSIFKLKYYETDAKGKLDEKHPKEVDSSFALGYFGLGFCNLRMGKDQLADANFQLAIQRQPSLARVVEEAKKPGTNTLIFIDYGQGPRMGAKGWYNEESAFGPTPKQAGPIPEADVYLDGTPNPSVRMPVPLVDTLALAQERQWQDIDTIRKVKAVVGTGMMAGGAGVAAYGANKGDTGMAAAGIGVALLGAALAGSSQADIRYWETLPRTVFVVPMGLSPGTHTVQVRVGGSVSTPFTINVTPANEGVAVYYVRLR